MFPISRRHALQLTGTGVGLSLAGCLGAGPGGNGGGADENGEKTDPHSSEYDVLQLGASSSRPAWHAGEVDEAGSVVLVDSRGQATWLLDRYDAVDGIEQWFEETDFSRSVVLYVQSVGPNACYTEVTIEDVTVDDRVRATATATDTSVGEVACAQVVSYPAALVRVTPDGDLPTEATVTIENGWGVREAVTSDGPWVDPERLAGVVEPAGSPTTTPPGLVCESASFRRNQRPDGEIVWGDLPGEDGSPRFALRVLGAGGSDDLAVFERGESATIRLTNVTKRVLETGNRYKYALELLTEDGWMDVRGHDEGTPLGYTDEALGHPPGEGFEWSLTLTEDGVLDGHVHEDQLEVCPGLPAGRYRFVFWGAIGGVAPAVAFDLVE